MYKFKNKQFNKRLTESIKIKNKYPGKIPIIVTKDPISKLPQISEAKYLISDDLTVDELIFIIKKRIKLEENKDLSIYIKNYFPNLSSSILEIYNRYKNNDGFLYVVYIEKKNYYNWMYNILDYFKIVYYN
jgi:GABA(A) receptor-associated protein